MVEQFGHAIILSSFFKVLPLISGIISALVSRQAEELSITLVPNSVKRGAHSKEIFPPAENIAMSGRSLTAFSIEIMFNFCS